MTVKTQLSVMNFFKLLSEPTRFNSVMLILDQGALCVCELETALNEDQPKVSRHLGLLREGGLLDTSRKGKWIYYDINENLPVWVHDMLSTAKANHNDAIKSLLSNLNNMTDRPERCCD